MRHEPHCLSADDLLLFLDGPSSPVEDSAVVEHLDGCAKCRAALEENAGGSEWIEHVHELLSNADGDDSVDRSGESSVAAAEPFLIANRLTFLAPSEDPRMLGRMGVYEISGVIGYGGMGVILKALEPSLNRYVALKVLWPHLAISAASRQRFAREAKAAAAVVHEHVVPISAVDEFRGIPYIVMRYVPGRSLQERIARQGWLQVDEILRIGRQIAVALDAAHAQGLVHRDVKPANILLENSIERVLVTDFGLARAADDASLTHSGMVAGTPQFMSPEQARGELMDPPKPGDKDEQAEPKPGDAGKAIPVAADARASAVGSDEHQVAAASIPKVATEAAASASGQIVAIAPSDTPPADPVGSALPSA